MQQETGAPAWDQEPRKARLNAGVVFTPARGVIHPCFPLRGRWLRTPETQASPFPLACNSVELAAETRPRIRQCTSVTSVRHILSVHTSFKINHISSIRTADR